MTRFKLRTVILLAAISILGVSATQVYWFKQAFDLEEDQFTRDVTQALHNVANKFTEIYDVEDPDNNPIKQLSTSYYVVNVNDEIDANLLEFLLRSEFDKRDIETDFEYGIYDCKSDKMVYGNYISRTEVEGEQRTDLPKWRNQDYYFGVNFPQKSSVLLNSMSIWLFSSIILIIVVLFFVYSLWVIFQQKRLSEVQKDFINNMTHEFKTPISTIALSTDVLKDPTIAKDPARLLNYATIIEKETKRMKGQVERVLQLAADNNSEIKLKREKVHLHAVIDKSVIDFEPLLKSKNGEISIAMDAENDCVFADYLHLENLFHNLIDNAIKYSESQPKIQISTNNLNQFIQIFVTDNGIGINKKDQSRIFNRFYRVSTGNRHDVKGFGLGLSYVKLIVEAHRGKIKVESEPGKGSSFIVELPLLK